MKLALFVAWSLLASTAQGLEFDAEVEASLRTQVADDLKYLSSLQGTGATPLHREIFGAVDGRTYWRWFDRRIQFIGKNLCGSDTAVACVLSAWDGWIFISPQYSLTPHPQVARLSVLLHEARHAENGGDWKHSRCPKPFLDENGDDLRSLWTGALLEREYACDFTANGAYATQVVFLKNVSQRCANCSEKVRADAEIYGADLIRRITDASARAKLEKDLALP